MANIDDFGDLYADVEAQASCAINAISSFTRLEVDTEEEDAENPNANVGFASEVKKIDFVKEDSVRSGDDGLAPRELGSEESGDGDVNAVDNGSDSEDDLNIVLNDDDCKFLGSAGVRNGGVGGEAGCNEDEDGDNDFVVLIEANRSGKNWNQGDQSAEGLDQGCNGQTGGQTGERGNGMKLNYNSHYKYMRHHGSIFPSNIATNGSSGVSTFSSMLTSADWEGNGYNLPKGPSSAQVARIHAKTTSVVPQSGYGFWLPRYRTILDVNIDTFEEKPWRYPGVDITDFFNFGFNEDSWKQYCNSLERYRQQSAMRTRIPVYESFKFNQVHGARSMHEKVAQEALSGDPQAGQGRIVSPSKLSDGNGRLSDLPKGRAIQVEDSIGERQSSMDIRCPSSWYSDVVIQINAQDSAEDSSGSGHKKVGHMDSGYEKTANRDLDGDGDADGDGHGDIHCCGSASGDDHSIESCEGNVRRLDRSSQPVTVPTMVSLDSGNFGNGHISDVDEHYPVKATVGTLEGIVKAMEIEKNTDEEVRIDTCDAYPYVFVAELSLDDQNLSSPTLSTIGSDSEVSEDSISGNPGKIHNSLKRPLLDSGTELQESVAYDYNINSLKSNEIKVNPCDSKDYYSRNKIPIRQEPKESSGRLASVAELKPHSENDGESINLSDPEVLFDRDRTSFDCSREKEGLHSFDCYNKEDFSYCREAELSCGYGSEKFADDHVQTVYKKYPHRKGHQSFRQETDPYLRKDWGDKDCLHEYGTSRVDNEDMDNDWHHGGRRFSAEDMSPVKDRGSRWVVSKHPSYTIKERNIDWRRKSFKLQFQKKADHGGRSHDYKNGNNNMHRRYVRSVSFSDRVLHEKYERPLQSSGRDLQNFGRRDRCRNSAPLDLGCSQSTECDDEHRRTTDHQSLPSKSYGESNIAGRRWHYTVPPRNVVYDSKSTERYGRHKKQICPEEGKDSAYHGSYNDANPDDRFHLSRRRCNRQSKPLHWCEDEFISRQQGDELYAEEEFFSCEKNSGHEKIHARSGTLHERMLIDDGQLEQHKYRKIREGNNANLFSRSSNISYRGKHEKTAQRSRDSVDLVVGDGKPSGRCSKSRSSICIGSRVNKDLKIVEQTTWKDSDESLIAERNHGNKTWLDKFVVAEQNQDLDLEEGQIVTGEPIKDLFGEKHVAEGAAPIGNMKNRILSCENAMDGNKAVAEFDNERILETLAKLEKRRARFKEPITLKKELDRSSNAQADLMVNTDESKQQRPARKRRWGGS